jgi:DNA-binding transcriptional ArsR family regulator
MARAAPDADVFHAIAEPRRRRLIESLARNGAQPVSALVRTIGLPQPMVSKHLGVLRSVGVVVVVKRGRQRIYELNAKELKPVRDWVAIFDRYWTNQLDRIKQVAERRAADRAAGRQ